MSYEYTIRFAIGLTSRTSNADLGRLLCMWLELNCLFSRFTVRF